MGPITLDGLPQPALARRWGVARVVLLARHPSSLDAAHEHGAAGAPDGTVVLVEEQTQGRGRNGRGWHSPNGGVWLAMLLRPEHAELAAASIRAGLVVADVTDELLGAPLTRLKWPNDVLCDDRKLAGVLCEGRWQGDVLQWLAVGIGINVCNPIPTPLTGRATRLADRLPSIRRIDVLDHLVPALARLTRGTARLTDRERAAFAARDWLAGRALAAPVAGRGAGLAPDGALLVVSPGAGVPTAVREGHVELA
jgi:BirA family biotin operon repressor/biotin-[acetyl-CoA-carboxylase] ligase